MNKEIQKKPLRLPVTIMRGGTNKGACPMIEDTFGFRTANLLMEGTAFIRL